MAVKETRIIENARLMFKNFSGAESEFNAAGDRNFCVALDPDTAQEMRKVGWNVKELPPRPDHDDDEPVEYIKVKLSYRFEERQPLIVRIAGKRRANLTERTVSSLDWDEIEHVDLEIRPYNWEKGNRTGVTAYLKSMYVTVKEDRLAAKYADLSEDSSPLLNEEAPF